MAHDLVSSRQQAMDEFYTALDNDWPGRQGEYFVGQGRRTVHELEKIIAVMGVGGFGRVEQSRTYRFLGSVYSDLEPALGKEMLFKARDAYQMAETLLEGQSDDFERAKLDFNFANTLRLIDPNDTLLLQDAKRRLLKARKYFAAHEPDYLPQVDSALASVETLLTIAPLTHIVEKSMEDVINNILNRNGTDKEKNEILGILRKRLTADVNAGKVASGRAAALQGILDHFGDLLSGDEDSIPDLIHKINGLRHGIADNIDKLHYLSHGIARPSTFSRAADLVELNWQLRRFLSEEMNRPEKGVTESKACLGLSVRATKLDRRIYEAGNDDLKAHIVEIEELRPLALEIRHFSGRMNSMFARPVWHSAKASVDVKSFFYSGSERFKAQIAAAGLHLELEIMPEPQGESYAHARWEQLQKAATTLFDFRVNEGPELAAVSYELGVALTLGKPMVVVIDRDQRLPFDVDVVPVELSPKGEDLADLTAAIDISLVRVYPRPRSKPHYNTLAHILSRYPRPQNDVYVDQTIKVLTDLRNDRDPLAMTETLSKLADYLDDGQTMLIQPFWPPVYPAVNDRRLFHVMPFRPKWADRVTELVRNTCENAGVAYIRGDEVDNPDVIRSIWEEIARASHVLVDLTGFNANVALELGIADTLGKNTRMVGQGNTVDHLFPSIVKRRFFQYDLLDRAKSIRAQIEDFIAP